jgi:hypothetical protein
MATAVETTSKESLAQDFSSSERKGRRNALTLEQPSNIPEFTGEKKEELDPKLLQTLSLADNNNNGAGSEGKS